MTCRVSLWVCLFVCGDAVKSLMQRGQPGGGIDVWLTVYTVIIIISLYITVRRLQSLLTQHNTATINSNAHRVVFYFTCNHRKTFVKHLQKCFRGGHM